MSPSPRTITTPIEAAAVTSICFGLSILTSLQAVASGFPAMAFNDAGLIWMVATELVLGAIALGFLQARRYAISSLFPAPTLQGCVVGIGLFFATWVVGWLLTEPFVGGLPEQPIDRMVHDANLSLPVIVLMAMVNGTYEEIFLLGFLLRGLRGFGLSVALGVMLLVRVLYHLYQGPIGALWVLAFGLVLGLYFIRSGRLWPAIFAHVLGDIVPFVFRDP